MDTEDLKEIVKGLTISAEDGKVNIRVGKLPDLPEIQEPEPLVIGDLAIGGISKYLINNKINKVNHPKALALYKKSTKTIGISLDPHRSEIDHDVFSSKLVVSEDSAKWLDEDGKKRFDSIAKFRKFLKFNSIDLAQISKFDKIYKTLGNVQVQIAEKMDSKDDDRGNIDAHYVQTVNSNIPKSFNLKLPLFEGFQKETFEVEMYLEKSGASVYLALESSDYYNMLRSHAEKIMDAEIEAIEKLNIPVLCTL